MLYLSAGGSVCDKTVPSHAAYALELPFLTQRGRLNGLRLPQARIGPRIHPRLQTAEGSSGLQTPSRSRMRFWFLNRRHIRYYRSREENLDEYSRNR